MKQFVHVIDLDSSKAEIGFKLFSLLVVSSLYASTLTSFLCFFPVALFLGIASGKTIRLFHT